MRPIAVSLALAGVVLLPADRVRAELRTSSKTEALGRTVVGRLCYAGRFRVERRDGDLDVVGRFVEQVPSCDGHPNAKNPGEVRVVRRGDDAFSPEVGKTYCLILTAGSKRGMTVVAFGPDDDATARAMREVISSPSAFENDATWRERRALWAKFRRDVGDIQPLVYGEDDPPRNILYLKPGEGPWPLFLYNARKGTSEPVMHAKVIPGVNRITYDHGYFRVWFSGSVELNVGVGGN
jgi:hypothetical protein